VLRKTRKFVCVILAALAVLSHAVATAMTVQPVVLNLSPGGRSMSEIVTVTNSFTYPLAVELTVEELTVDTNGVTQTGRDPGDLVVFPPTAMIQPGQTQTFRVQYVGDPALARSKHYYVTVAQLPVKAVTGAAAVQVLYNFQVLVSVAPVGAKPDIQVTAAQIGHAANGKPAPALTFANRSSAHGYLSDGKIRIVEKDSSGKEVLRRELSAPEVQQAIGFGLVGAGQTRRVVFPLELPDPAGTVEAQFTPDH